MSGKYFESFDKAKIYYHKTTKDKNKWLIFLHGLGGDLTAWNKEKSYFNKLGISTIAIDLRGHGFSERSKNQDFYKLENFAKDVKALLRHESIENAIIIGHCFGGMISIYFQSLFPNSSKGLILIDTSYKPPFISNHPVSKILFSHIIGLLIKVVPNVHQKGHVNFDQFTGTQDLNFKRILSDILHTSLRSYLMLCDRLVNLNAEKLLEKITVPTLVIEGTNDSIFPPQIAQLLSNRIKNSQLSLIEGANHIVVINNPKDLEKSMESFLRKISFI
jgi:pimeloyl-ACP methyl ester carboxylesterase